MTTESQTPNSWISKSADAWDFVDDSSRPLSWPSVPQYYVTRMAIGNIGEHWTYEDETSQLSSPLPENFADLFPNLRALHFWNLSNLESLPRLPADLEQLEIRNCEHFPGLPELPSSLSTLVIDATAVAFLETLHGGPFPQLVDLSIRQTRSCPPAWISRVLDPATSPKLQRFDATGCDDLKEIPHLPSNLTELVLDDCVSLKSIPSVLPASLRKLSLHGCVSLEDLPNFPANLDFVDVSQTERLSQLPANRGRPSTLQIYDSELDLPPELLGKEKPNRADDVEAFLSEIENHGSAWDHEVKVILIGNGRCGKTSLAKRLIEDCFDPGEESTHGINLWRLNQTDFLPVDGPGENEFCEADLNIWDFAGQDLYHNTHRLFYHNKCVFVICESAYPEGLGSDEVTDGIAAEAAKEDKDTPKEIEYWLSQISHLDNPPVIRVKTKADRIQAQAPVIEAGTIQFSAKTGNGRDELNAALRIAVGQVLGKKGARTVPRRLLELKEWIQTNYKIKNAEAFQNHQPPPFPRIDRQEFDRLVTEKLPDSYYSRNPKLALDFFHQSGFLYADGDYLKDTVILDLRWAIDAIYTALDRGGAWLQLNGHGRFTADQLRRLGWTNEKGEDIYDPESRNLFINFMREVGMIFELIPSWRRRDGETEYLLPQALPDRKTVLEKRNPIAGKEPDPDGSATVEANQEQILKLMVKLGREWGTSAVFWKWGGMFPSFRKDQNEVKEGGWVELDFDEDRGLLTFTAYDGGIAFRDAIIKDESLEEYQGDDFETHPLEVGISFAGGPGREGWPLALAEALVESGITVENYRIEQGRPRIDKTASGKDYLDAVVSKDYTFVFLSDKYLRSEYCCYELMKIVLRLGENHSLNGTNAGLINAASYPDLNFTDSLEYEIKWGQTYDKYHLRALKDVAINPATPELRRDIQRKYRLAEAAINNLDNEPGEDEHQIITEFREFLHSLNLQREFEIIEQIKKNEFGEWLEWQSKQENRIRIFEVVKDWRHSTKVDDDDIDAGKLDEWVKEIRSVLDKETVMLSYARFAEEQGKRDLAIERYQKALQCRFGRDWQSHLAEVNPTGKWEVDLMNAIR